MKKLPLTVAIAATLFGAHRLGAEQLQSDDVKTTTTSMASNELKGENNYSKPSNTILRQKLTPLQYLVTQLDGTERAFKNEYWNDKREGIYVDIVSGEPLFSSRDKYKSGTGWPSFTRPINNEYVVTKTDYKLGIPRTEVRSLNADSHLGHIFNDGPKPTGKRYCINSASLQFIPKDELKSHGLTQLLSHFE